MFKFALYKRALVEVSEQGTKYLSSVPWGLYIYYLLDRLLTPEKYNDFKIRLLMPWQFVIDKGA